MPSLLHYQGPHCSRMMNEVWRTGIAFDGSDTGTGKTFTTCFTLAGLYAAAVANRRPFPVLVICPKVVVPSWKETLELFGIPNTEVKSYESAWRHCGQVKPHGQGSYFIFSDRYSMIVFDEVHRCGGNTTINSKMLIAAKRANVKFGTRVIALSATAADTPLRLKALGFLLDLHHIDDFAEFLLRCGCKPGKFGGWTWSSKDNKHILAFLNEEIYQRGSRMRIKDIPDFPKYIRDVKVISGAEANVARLSKEMQAFYNERSVAALETESDLAEITFRRQAFEAAKIPGTLDLAEDAMRDSKVAVFFNFKATVKEFCAEAAKRGWKHAAIDGDSGDDERWEAERAFKANELDIIFVNNQAGGAGLSLHDPVTQYPRTSLHLPSYSSLQLKQAVGRTVRANGGFSRQHLIYFDTPFEMRIARIVRSKLDNLALLNDAELCGDFRQ